MADSLITIEDIMSISETLLPEFDQEMATTRRLLERVPSDKGKRSAALAASGRAASSLAR